MEPLNIAYKNRELSLQSPVVMGIVNLTTDSFYEGSRSNSLSNTLKIVESMIADGVSIVDLGAQSSRPGATLFSPEHEIEKLIPTIEKINAYFPEVWVSVDTFYASVAEASIASGAHIINDISAGEYNPEMLQIVGKYGTPYIAMHKKGDPQTMQNNPQYENIIEEVFQYFKEKEVLFQQCDIAQWILDVGYGFGKTVEHNYQLLNHSEKFLSLKKPILTGISRKSMIYKPLNIKPEEALNGTTALHMAALNKGTHILRVHDVKAAMECIKLHLLLKNNSCIDYFDGVKD